MLVEPRSVEALHSAIVSIDEDNYSTMSEVARQYFEQNFDQARVLAEVYDQIKHLTSSQKA